MLLSMWIVLKSILRAVPFYQTGVLLQAELAQIKLVLG